jgi:hypothetical protein
MSGFKRGGSYYYEFVFKGERIQESTRLTNRTAALQAEAIRRAELAEAGLESPVPGMLRCLSTFWSASSCPGPKTSTRRIPEPISADMCMSQKERQALPDAPFRSLTEASPCLSTV